MSVEISKKLLFFNSLSGIALKILNVTILVWLQRYLLTRISTEEYSILPVVYSIMVFFPFCTTMLTSGLSRFMVEAYAKEETQKITQITSTMFSLLLLVSVPILVIGLLLAWNIEHVLNIAPAFQSDAHLMLSLLIVTFVINTTSMPFQAGLYVRQKFIRLNGIHLLKEIVRIAILFALLFSLESRVLWVVTATVSANLLEMVAIILTSRRLVPAIKFQRRAINWSIARTITSFGGWSLLGQLGTIVQKNADTIILNKLASAIDVTCFYLGSMPHVQLGQFFSKIKAPLIPQLTALHANDMKRDFQYAFLRGNRLGLWIAMFPVVPILVFSKELVTLWVGSEFIVAAEVAVLLLATYPIIYANFLMGPVAIAMAEIRETSTRSIIVQLLNLGLTLCLVGIFEMGAIGSALSTFVSMTVFYPILTYRLVLRMVDIKAATWIKETLLPGWIPGIATTGVAFTTKRILAYASVDFSTLLEVLAGLMFCSVLYILATYLCFKEKDHRDLREVINKLRRRHNKPGEKRIGN